MNYYNDNDPYCCAWLRNLIAAGHLPAGEVDERPIQSVTANDVRRFRQCHFFAGIGGWPLALKLAGWPEDRAVWTGSCPCQPFSLAGASAGFNDQRHLWPIWFHLIRECRPHIIFGEQVESAIGHGWLDLVHDDLEGAGYAFAPIGLPAACAGAFHIRQRVWFVANTAHERRSQRSRDSRDSGDESRSRATTVRCNDLGALADVHPDRRGADAGREFHDTEHNAESRSELGDTFGNRLQGRTETDVRRKGGA